MTELFPYYSQRMFSYRDILYFNIVIAIYYRDGTRKGVCYVYFIPEFIDCYRLGLHLDRYSLCISGITIDYRNRIGPLVCYINFICLLIDLYIRWSVTYYNLRCLK